MQKYNFLNAMQRPNISLPIDSIYKITAIKQYCNWLEHFGNN